MSDSYIVSGMPAIESFNKQAHAVRKEIIPDREVRARLEVENIAFNAHEDIMCLGRVIQKARGYIKTGSSIISEYWRVLVSSWASKLR